MSQTRQQGPIAAAPIGFQPVDAADLGRWADAGVLYALIDACISPVVPSLARARAPDQAACLYLGTAAANFRDKAPYLIRADPALIGWIGETFGDRPWGCYLLSTAGFAAVRRQLRQFLTVISPMGESWLFRFYDPRLLPIFLKNSTAAEVNDFFGPIDGFLSVDANGAGHSVRRNGEIVAPPRRRAVGERFRLSDAHLAGFRRQQIGDALIQSFDGTAQRARRDPANDDILVDNPDGGTMRLAHDAQGFIGAITSPLGRSWQLTSDERGKLMSMRLPSGTTVALDYDGAGRIAQVSRDGRARFRAVHDEHGRLERLAFPDGSDFSTRYCDTGRAGVIDPDGIFVAARSDRLNRVERFDYDGDALVATIDGNGNATRLAYGQSLHPDALIHPDGAREAYRYDPAGHLQSIVRADDSAIEISCDKAGRPVRMATSDGAEAVFDYDDAGRLVAASNAEIALAWRYDEGGRLIEERQGEVVIGYAYDAADTLIGLTYPTGETIAYEHDADLRLSAMIDWSGRRYALNYGPDDRTWQLASPDGVVTTTACNPAGLTIAMQIQRNGSSLFETSFGYDDEDRLRERQDTRLGACRYDYDAEGQVILAERSTGRRETFAYDDAGNRTRCAEGPARFNALNQLLEQGDLRCLYDARGNLVERRGADRSWAYAYDGFDRLVSADDGWGHIIRFGYDALGRRISKQVIEDPHGTPRTRTTRYIWAGEQMIREVVETSHASPGEAQTRDYLYWPRTHTPLLLREAGATYQYHTDPGGAPVRLTDASGDTVWEADYDAFGTVRTLVDRVQQPWRFAGQYHDRETELHYNRFRYYDPVLGRYISRDPIGSAGGLNLYQYAGNDPIGRSDPLGLWWKTALSIVAAVAVAALVVITAPVSAPALLVAVVAGAAAGAVGFGLNEALNEDHFCASCILGAMLKGALIGAAATVPFLLLPEAAGIGVLMAAGAASGFINYAGTVALTPGMPWNWADAAKSTAIGAALGPLGRLIGAARSRFRPVAEPEPVAPVEPGESAPSIEPAPSAKGADPAAPNGQAAEGSVPSGRVRGPDGRFVSSGEAPATYNRSTQYPSGYRAGVVDEVLDANTISSGPKAGMVRTADGDIVARDDPRLTIEHNQPVVEHWNETGYNSTRAARNDFYNETENMSLRLRSPNSADGGRMSAAGVRYRQDVGPDYSR